MVGYPYYNSINNDDDLFSSKICFNSKVFVLGMVIGMSFLPSEVFAADALKDIGVFEATATVNVTGMNLRQRIATLAAISGTCGLSAKCVETGAKVLTEKAAEKPSVAAVVGCTFVMGWCVGQLFDKGVKKFL